MKVNFRNKIKSPLLIVLLGVLLSNSAFSLTCQDVRQLIFSNYLRLHFSSDEMSPELGKRTLNNYIKYLDPGKVYFYQSDVDKFLTEYDKKLSPMLKKADCSVIDVLFSLYSKRFSERQKLVKVLVEDKHDYTIDESLNLDRKKQAYLANEDQAKDRWRKRIKLQLMQLNENVKTEDKAKEKLTKRYELLKKRHEEMNTDDVYGIFLDAFANSLDPHSDYFSPTQLEEFRISTRLSLEGIGALLRSEDGITTIQSLIPGGAAFKSGKIKVEDKIVAVAQAKGTPVDVIDMDLKDVVKLIRGPGGTTVRLTIRRDGKELVIPLAREKIQLQDKAAQSKVHEVEIEVDGKKETKKIGVLDLPSFYIDFEGRGANRKDFRSSSKDMLKEIRRMQTDLVDGIIVDLRSNGGGALDEAVDIAGLFTGKGPVVQIKGQAGSPSLNHFQGNAAYKGPLILLIDSQSASSSEILAGAIKDYNRGLIVGDSHTFGKGTVQHLIDLDTRLGAIKVTISKFYLPSGVSTQVKGVASDIVLPSVTDAYEIGEKYYDFALPWAKIDSTKHYDFNQTAPYIDELAKRSQSRVEKSKDFKEIEKAIGEYQKKKKDRYIVSLKKKSKEEIAKEEKERKEVEASLKKDKFGNYVTSIEDDPRLHETVLIAADYVSLLNKQKIGKVQLKKKPTKVVLSSPGSAKNLKGKKENTVGHP